MPYFHYLCSKQNNTLYDETDQRRIQRETGSAVCTVYQSPAEDYLNESLDFNRDLIKHPEATFYAVVDGDSMTYAVVDGDSMTGLGIHPGEIGVLD